MKWRERETVEERASAALVWINKRIDHLKECPYSDGDPNMEQAKRSLEGLDLVRQIVSAIIGK